MPFNSPPSTRIPVPAMAKMIASTTSADWATPGAATSVHSSGEWLRPPGPPRPMVSAAMPMLIGMLLSVLLIEYDGFKPKD